MKVEKQIAKRRNRRGLRIGNRVRRSAHGRPRLSVYRSNKHIYAQIIDDGLGQTLASAATVEKDLNGGGAGGNKAAAEAVGKLLAERAVEKGIRQVVFDRGNNRYHGRVAALATAARQAGLEF
jgi:large subunit ribosomal protein L18